MMTLKTRKVATVLKCTVKTCNWTRIMLDFEIFLLTEKKGSKEIKCLTFSNQKTTKKKKIQIICNRCVSAYCAQRCEDIILYGVEFCFTDHTYCHCCCCFCFCCCLMLSLMIIVIIIILIIGGGGDGMIVIVVI